MKGNEMIFEIIGKKFGLWVFRSTAPLTANKTLLLQSTSVSVILFFFGR